MLVLLFQGFAFAENCIPVKDIRINSLGGYSTLREYSQNLEKAFSEQTKYNLFVSLSDGFGIDYLRQEFYDQTMPVTINVRMNEANCQKDIDTVRKIISELVLKKNLEHTISFQLDEQVHDYPSFYEDVYINLHQDFRIKEEKSHFKKN